MKKIITLIIIIVVAGLLLYLYFLNDYGKTIHKKMKTDQNLVQVIPIEHASGILVWNGKNIYMDPVGDAKNYQNQPLPDIILITDIHGDHFSLPTLKELAIKSTIIAPKEVIDKMPSDLSSKTKLLKNGETLEEQGFKILAVPMYNLPDKDNKDFHVKGRGNGYILENNGFRVYIAGDTADTPEMRELKNIDIAFIPMNLPYTMSVEDAADAVIAFKPKMVYPYHYRNKDGLSDVNKFKELVGIGDSKIQVVLAEWYK